MGIEKNFEEWFLPDLDYRNDLGPLSWKMITYTGFEKDISKVLGKDSYEFMNFNFNKLNEDIFISCVGAWVPVKKVLHNLVNTKNWLSAIDDKDILFDLTDSSEEEGFESIFDS
jgi:hypothetical protein